MATRVRTALFAFAAAASAGAAWAAPITFNTALPVSKGEVLARQQFILTRLSDTNGGTRRAVTLKAGVSVLGYGVSPKFAVFGVLPVVNIDRTIGTMHSNTTGLGDAKLFARAEIFRRDRPGRTVRIAPFAGLTLPTGDKRKAGDGAVDGFGGLIVTTASTNWNFDAQIRYDHNTSANGFERGDAASADASLQVRLAPKTIAANTSGFFYGVMEANLTYSQRDRLGGLVNPDSGGVQATLSPGMQYATRRWIAETALKIPVVKDLHGLALAPDYALVTSMRFNF